MKLRILFLLTITFAFSYYVLSIIFNNVPLVIGKKINLGLDIKGGSYLRLKIDHEHAMNEYLESLSVDLEHILKEKNIDYSSIELDQKLQTIKIIINDLDLKHKIQKNINFLEKDFNIKYSNNIYFITPKNSFVAIYAKNILHDTMESIKKRIDSIGTNDIQINYQGLNYISVQIPGAETKNSLKNIIGKNAKLSFHLLADQSTKKENIIVLSDDLDNKYKINKNPLLSGNFLKRSSVSYGQMNEPTVTFVMNDTGTKIFADITKENIGKTLVIVLDDKVLTAPTIRDTIIAGKGEIKGEFNKEEANELSILLRSGTLPAPITIEEEKIIGPSLGGEIVKYGIRSTVISMLAISICMILAYKIFGLFAVIALILNIMIIFTLVSILEITITLPGIAGLILTIGMAVDNNILIFERIKEINIESKDMQYAIKRGFIYAKTTIFDANITTLIAAFTMFVLGVNTIKGFAVMLIIGIFTSIFTSINITYSLIYIWNKFKMKYCN